MMRRETPVTSTPSQPTRIDAIRTTQRLNLLNTQPITFIDKQHILFRRTALAYHPNGMTFAALNSDGAFYTVANPQTGDAVLRDPIVHTEEVMEDFETILVEIKK
mgnify:CR=1 FL=1